MIEFKIQDIFKEYGPDFIKTHKLLKEQWKVYNAIYDILFKATSESILKLSADKKWLGAKVGITSVLHT